jgi:tape measure domain-containing protein
MPLKNVTEATGDYGVALGFITKLADQTGQDLFVLGDSYKGLYASAKQAGIATSEINNIFKSVVDAGSALKLSNEQVSLSLKAVEQMMNKGTISSEELKGQLGEQLPGAYGMMAKAAQDAGLSVSGSTQELGKLLDEGRLASAEVLPFFAKRMEEAFGKNAEANINTISGSANRFNNELTLLIDALDNGKVISFWATFQNSMADVFKDLSYYINSGSWKEFISHFGVNGGLRAQRIKIEGEKSFAQDNKSNQSEVLKSLVNDLRYAQMKVGETLKDGTKIDNEYRKALNEKILKYVKIFKETKDAASSITVPTLKPKDSESGIKAVKDYTFELALLNLEIKNTQKNIKELNEARELSNLKTLGRTSVSPIPFTMSRSEDASKKDKGLIDQLFGEDLNQSTANLQAKFEALKSGIKPIITDFGSAVSEDVKTAMNFVSEGMNLSFSFLGDTLAAGFASVFNKDIKFDFKKLLGNFLSGLGDMVMRMAIQMKAVAALKTKIELALSTLGGGGFALAGAAALFALGAAMKGGGMALSSSSVGSSSTSVSNSTGARNIVPNFNPSGFNNTVKFEIQGNTLVGVLNNVNRANG